MKKQIISLITAISLIVTSTSPVMAHSGRTDSNGGHRDNKTRVDLDIIIIIVVDIQLIYTKMVFVRIKAAQVLTIQIQVNQTHHTRMRIYRHPNLRLSGSETNIGLAIVLREAGRK